MTQEGDENDGTGDVSSGHRTENVLAKSENEDKISSLGETTDENMFIADIKVDDGSDLREGQVYYVRNKHGKVTEMIFTGRHLKEIKTEKEDFKQEIKTKIVENRTEANQNKCVLRNESSTDNMIQVKTEKCDNENHGILTAPVDTVNEAIENKSAIQNDNRVDNNIRVKTEKCEGEHQDVQTKSVNNRTEGIQNTCTFQHKNCIVKNALIKTEKSNNAIKTEVSDMDDVSKQNENWQTKEIKKEQDDSHANSCVHNGSSTVDSKPSETKSTNKDKKSEDIEPQKTLKGNNNASFVDIDRRNGETGRVRVKLEGGGEFEEGQIYVGRTRQGEIKQMAWKDGKLVELSSVPVTTDMDTSPQPATRERKPPPHNASFQQEFPPLTKLHQNQQMRHQLGNRQQRHASRLLAIAKIRQQIQEINRFPVLEGIQKHEVNKSCMQRKTQHQHKHEDKQRQKYKSNQSDALKRLLRAQQQMLTEGKTIHQKRIGRFAKMAQIMTRLGQRQGQKPPLQQNQDKLEQMSLKECISKSKRARLDRLRQKLFEKRSKHRLLELNKQFTTTKQNLLTMEQRTLQNQVDHLEKQIQVENEDMTEEIDVQNQDKNKHTKNLAIESHGKQLGNRGQGQNRDEWINRIRDTLESGSAVALQQDKREGQRQANVSQSKQKQTDQMHQPQDANEDKRQNWIGRIKDTLSKGVPHRRQGVYDCSGETNDQRSDKQAKSWSTLQRQETKQMRLRQKKRNKQLHEPIQGLSFRFVKTEDKDSDEQDVIQRELEITKRLIDRNTRNLQHYKQTYRETPQHNTRTSAQQDTVGQKRMTETPGSHLKPSKDELSNNLSQIIRNTEKLKEYIRTRKENDSSVQHDTKRMRSLVIEDPSKNDSDIILRELDQTKRQIERNARNLQHYKQIFGETPQHQPQTSSQQDTIGQVDDKSAQFKSSSTCNKKPQALTMSSRKAKRHISTIVISDDEDDQDSTAAKRKKGNQDSPTSAKVDNGMPGTPGKNKINSHVRVSDRTGMKAADKQNKIKSDQKRPSDDSTVHGNQSVKEAVNTNVVDTKSLVGESKRLPGQSEARNECCIPSKQMKRSVVPTRFSHSSNGSPKRGTPILKSTFGQSKSSASNTSNVSSHLQRSLPANRSHWDVPVGDRRVRHLSGLDALPIFAPLENISGLSSDQDQRSSNNSAISTATQSSQSLSSSRPGTTSSLPVSTSSGSNASNISPSVRRRRLPAYGSRWDVWGRAPQSSNNSKHRSPWDVSPISVPLTRVSGLSPTSEQQPSNNSAINTATATSPTFLFSPAVSSSQFLKEETTSHALTPVRKSPAVHDQKLRLTPPKSFHPYESVPPKKPLKRKHPAAQQFNESSNVSSNLPIASKTKPSSTDRISPMPIKQEKVDCAQRTRSGPSLNSDSELGQKLVGKKNDEPLTQMSRHSTPFRSPGPSAFRSPPKRRLVAEGIRIDAITHASVNASGSFSTTPSRMSSSAMASASSTVSAAPSSSINTNSPRSGYRRLSNSGRNYHCLPKKGYPPWSGTGPTTKSLSSTFSSYSTSSQDISSANITTASITTASSSKTGNALSINPLSNRSHDCLPRRGYAPRDGTKPPTTSLSQPTPRPTTSTTQASASAFTTISLPTSTTASPIADTAVPYFTHRRLSNMGRSYTYLGKRGYPPLNGTRSTLASLSQPISTSSTPQSQSPTSVSTTTSLSTSTAASSTVDTSLSRSAHRRVSNSGRSYPYLPKRRLCLASKPVSESQVVSNTSSNVASFCSPSNQRLTVSQSTISATSNSSTSSTGASYSVSSRISSSCSSGAPLKITLRRNKSDKTSSAQNSSGMTGRGTGLNVSTRSSTGINLRSLHNPSKFASMNVKPKPSIFRPLGKAKKQNTKTGDDKPLPGTSGLTDKGDNQKPGTSSMTDKGDKSDSEDGDCTVCFERPVNAALIPCGHLSMCYECAVKVKKRDRLCPLCRQPIKSVLRVYKS